MSEPARTPPTSDHISAAFPLSAGQKSLWFIQQVLPDSAVYHIALAVRILTSFDVAALQAALQAIVDRHEALRSVFGVDANGELIQRVYGGVNVAFEVIDTTRFSSDQVDAAVTAAFRSPFDLATGPLFRSHLFTDGSGSQLLLITAHHLVFDALSLVRVLTELLELYSTTPSGANNSLLPIKAQYRDFVEWQTQMLAGPEGRAHLEFWREELDGAPPVLDLPADRPRPAHPSGRGGSLWFPIEETLVQAVKALAADLDVYPFDIFTAAWHVLLYRYSGQTDLLVGFVTGGRPHLRYARTIGSFSNTIVLRACLEGDPVFATFLQRQHQRLEQGLAHGDYPLPVVVEKVNPVRSPGYMPLIQALFTYFMPRGSRLSELFVSGHEPAVIESEPFAMESYGLKQEDIEFDLAMSVVEGKQCWGRVRFDADLFDQTTIQRLAAHYMNLLQGVVADPLRTVSSLPLLGEAERQEILFRWNQTRVDYAAASTVCQLFEAQVSAAPDRVAVVCGNQQLTYAELNAQAGSLAAYLRECGAVEGSLIGVCVERSVRMLVALLAVWKAGAAYIPLDPHFPKARLDLIVEDAAPRTILTEAALAGLFSPGDATVIELDTHEDRWRAVDPMDNLPPPSGRDLAYVIYTSGSTGKPKGVEIPHSALTNFLCSMRKRPGIEENDVLLAVTTFSFDIAGLELFLPLIAGARVAIATREIAHDARELAREIEIRGVTLLQATPATWRLLIDSDWAGCTRLKALCGGEKWTGDLARKLLPRVASLWNMYGPTETTVWSAVGEVGPNDDPIPFGSPIDNTTFYILDRNLEPVPIGVAGELHIGGAGLADGYRNLPDRTAERFVQHPFVAGERLYKTGDLCRQRADGSILFLGRLDDQVKLRGHRIELGEIESVLLHHPAVQEAAVVMNEEPGLSQRLAAYMVAPGGVSPAPGATLKEFLSAQLPEYMIPSAFVYLDSLPVTPNSKVDRKALRDLAIQPGAEKTEYVPPRTPSEVAVAGLWAEMLKAPRVGAHDRFDELGGDSLSFALMTIRAGNQLGIKIPVRMDDETMTLAGFARAADRIASEQSPLPAATASPLRSAAPAFQPEPLTRTWYGQILVKTCAWIVRCLADVEADGLENLPARGPAIIAANHISLFDMAILGSVMGDLKGTPVIPTFVIADKWRWLAQPYVSQLGHAIYIRRGQGDAEALRVARDVLANKGALAITPEGRPTRGALTRAKPGIAYLACETGAPVSPLAIFGHDRIFDFWKKLHRAPVRIRVGQRLDLNDRGHANTDLQQHADFIMKAIAQLMPREYHGVYSGEVDGQAHDSG